MDELNRALGDIRSIRRQMAGETEFRGYGPVTLAGTGGLALLAAGVQALAVPHPESHVAGYIAIWVVTAVFSAAWIGVQTVNRAQRMHSGMADEMIRMAVEQFVPSLVVGALATVVLVRSAPAAVWMLPGLWQMVFSLGIFASCRFMPRPVIAVGVWYLLTGLACLSLGGERALSPWTMGAAYGVGQAMVAGIVYVSAR